MLIKNSRVYDQLKFLAQIVLPAIGTLYFTLAGIWGLPAAEEVVGTIVAVDTFLGVILQLSANSYAKSDAKFDGSIDVSETEGKTVYTLNLDTNPEALKDMSSVNFKVKSAP